MKLATGRYALCTGLQSDQVELKYYYGQAGHVMYLLQSDQVELKYDRKATGKTIASSFNRTRWN